MWFYVCLFSVSFFWNRCFTKVGIFFLPILFNMVLIHYNSTWRRVNTQEIYAEGVDGRMNEWWIG